MAPVTDNPHLLRGAVLPSARNPSFAPVPDTRVITLADIRAAEERIARFVQATPLVRMTPGGPTLKAESLHPTGAFKLRGAFNSILALTESQRRKGVVAHSSGNHALAVAYACHKLGVRAVTVMPEDAPRAKLEGARQWGAEMVLVGPSSSERSEAAAALARQRGLVEIAPYDSEEILTATGTIGLEILAAMPEVQTVFAPVGGAGLIGGLAAAIKYLNDRIRVIGVEPEVAADAYESFLAHRIVELPASQMARTIADGLRVQKVGRRNWAHMCEFVDEIVTVSEAQISRAMFDVATRARLIAEPSGAVAVAAAVALSESRQHCVAILSGGNVDRATLARAFAAER